MRDTIESILGSILIVVIVLGAIAGIVFVIGYVDSKMEQLQCDSLQSLYPDIRFENNKNKGCVFQAPSGRWFDAGDFEILYDELFSK